MSENKGHKSKFKEKVDTLNRFLVDEHMLVHLTPRIDGVQLPDYLMKNSTVTLKLSRYFRGSLDITKSEVRTELLFNDKYIMCIIPLDAIWGMTSFRGQFLMWPESTPQEIFDSIIQQAKEDKEEQLKIEEAAGAEERHFTDDITEEEPQAPKKEIKRGHLRRIK